MLLWKVCIVLISLVCEWFVRGCNVCVGSLVLGVVLV